MKMMTVPSSVVTVLFSQIQNELMEAVKAETFYEGDSLPYAEEDCDVSHMAELEKKLQEEREREGTNVLMDFDGLPLYLVSYVRCGRDCKL